MRLNKKKNRNDSSAIAVLILGLFVLAALFATAVVVTVVRKDKTVEATEAADSAVFIIDVSKHPAVGGGEMWLFQYAIDGHVEQAVFRDAASCTRFAEYLKTVGRIVE
jgi:mannose/fructose/N-acetylgalactosamine-specific phosphotransferase system component IID